MNIPTQLHEPGEFWLALLLGAGVAVIWLVCIIVYLRNL